MLPQLPPEIQAVRDLGVTLFAGEPDVVQPIALARFGQPVAQIDSMGAYSCRPIDNQRGNRLSEHSFGNAVDIGGFRLADGRTITVVKGWTRGNSVAHERTFW